MTLVPQFSGVIGPDLVCLTSHPDRGQLSVHKCHPLHTTVIPLFPLSSLFFFSDVVDTDRENVSFLLTPVCRTYPVYALKFSVHKNWGTDVRKKM